MKPFRTLVSTLILVACALAASGSDDKNRTGKDRTVWGRVSEVQPGGNQLTLKTRDGRELRLHVDAESRLLIEGRPAKLNQFKEGDRAQVTYAELPTGKDRVVRLAGMPATAADLKREVREALDAVKSYTFRQKDEYQKKLESLLEDVDGRLEDLRDRAEDVGAEARKELAREIELLRQKQQVIRDRLAKVKSAGADAWDDIKAGIGDALDDLQQAFERARSRFR